MAHLQARGVAIYLISGGFQSIIEGVADALNIPTSHIYANRFTFYYNGKCMSDLSFKVASPNGFFGCLK